MVVLDIVPVTEDWAERQHEVVEEDEQRLIDGAHEETEETGARKQQEKTKREAKRDTDETVDVALAASLAVNF